MDRLIVDLPPPVFHAIASPWRLDWRGQSAGESVGDSEQIVFNRLQRWAGTLPILIPRDMIPSVRAIITRLEGRRNALRVRMVDPAAAHAGSADHRADQVAWRAGHYSETRPQIVTVTAADPGDTELIVDETGADRPVLIGQRISIDDWPVEVTGRSGSGSSVTLTVAPFLRRAVANGASVDLIARGIFVLTGELPDLSYGPGRVATPTLNLIEWVTRA